VESGGLASRERFAPDYIRAEKTPVYGRALVKRFSTYTRVNPIPELHEVFFASR